jgi:hypothetical protein
MGLTDSHGYIGKPCEWSQDRPQGHVRLRGVLQLTRYHPASDPTLWRDAFSLDVIGTGCIVQIDGPRERLLKCDGWFVEVGGAVLEGGAVAPYTMIPTEIDCLRRYDPTP